MIPRTKKNDFWTLWCENQPYLEKHCRIIMRGRKEDSEDLLSQSMLKMQETYDHHQTYIKNFKAWAKVVIKNFCLDFYRRKAKYQSVCMDDVKEVYSQLVEQQTPETEFILKEEYTICITALKALPSVLRQIYLLRIYKGYSYREIGKAQEISDINARKRMQKARELIAQNVSNKQKKGLQALTSRKIILKELEKLLKNDLQ